MSSPRGGRYILSLGYGSKYKYCCWLLHALYFNLTLSLSLKINHRRDGYVGVGKNDSCGMYASWKAGVDYLKMTKRETSEEQRR
jgi:hypothetical protein